MRGPLCTGGNLKRRFISTVTPNYASVFRYENGAFQKRCSNRRNLKTPASHFSVDGKHFENEAFRKR